jgi:hypothetical protein
MDAGRLAARLSSHPDPADDHVVSRCRRHHPVLAVLAGLAVAGSLSAEPPISQEVPRRLGDLPGTPQRPATVEAPEIEVFRIDLRAVEPRTSDRGPLDASLRWVQPGLQLPAGYQQIYRLESGGFMRADGGLAATFDQSVYQPTARGDLPIIPASTVFVIGGVPLGAESGHGWLLGVDPLDPGAVPRPFAPTATPDDAHQPSAAPGDRLRRFGFSAGGHRMPDRVDPEGHEGGVDVSGSRFLRDQAYRASRLASRLASWRSAQSVASAVTSTRAAGSTTDATPPSTAEASPTDQAP